jgi:membrane-bound lytic murein transglycosylase B
MKSQLTIADYINRCRPDRQLSVKPMVVAGSSPKAKTFQEILSAAGAQHKAGQGGTIASPPRDKGLTLSDYLKNPLSLPRLNMAILPSNSAELTADPRTEPEDEAQTHKPLTSDAMIHPACGASPRPDASQNAGKTSEIRQKIDACISTASRKYSVSENLIRGIVRAESGFQPSVVSPAGARGLMQLMPGTARDLGVENPFDIEENIDGGVRYFKQMMDRFGGDVKMALAAYNAGPGTVERYEGIPPYKETRQYIQKVIRFSGETA